MFEALFILTTVDAGTRAARYVLQELLGKVHKPFANTAWLPGNIITTALIVAAWGYLIYTGSVATIWPLFGTGNQLLATIALAVTSTFLVNQGKVKYAWITAVPMLFVGVTTFIAGIESVRDIFWPMAMRPSVRFQGWFDSTLMVLFIVGVVLVVGSAARRCWQTVHGVPLPPDASGPVTPEESGHVVNACC
jgi:carbon starvation protein